MTTIIIVFTHKGDRYRMRVACVHVHPGESDRIEVAYQDMLGVTAWTALPDGSSRTPSAEWLVRRALWRIVDNSLAMERSTQPSIAIINLGEI